MPKRNDFKTVLVIGSGPIVIGQACEFDYSGVQACQALRNEGYRVVLLNSNPATVMTDHSMAEATYIEPMRAEVIEQIIGQEKVDAILPTMGGQTAINLTMELHRSGYLQKHNIKLIGANPEVIERAEDRFAFNQLLKDLQLEAPKGQEVSSVEQAWKCAELLGFPLIVRPSYTLGGKGGGIVRTSNEFETKIAHALAASPIGKAFVEESVLGWKEFELEVIRDKRDNCIVVCAIENLDPMGVHTGDSITVAPALTLTDKEYQQMRDAAFRIIRGVGVETGGANVQFAVNPKDGRMVVIEMNPRVSRSSALASKATGFPIAKVAAKLAVGYTLNELPNEVTQKSCAAFEPSIDYVVTKIPRFDFAKFKGVKLELTTAMQSVGEVMALGRTFAESLQKALRSLEQGHIGLSDIKYPRTLDGSKKREFVREKLLCSTPETLFYIAEAYRLGFSESEIHNLCHWDPWFLQQIETLVSVEQQMCRGDVLNDPHMLRYVKSLGFSNQRIAQLIEESVDKVETQLKKFNIKPQFRRVDTCAAEFSSPTAYLYSSFLPFESNANVCEAQPTLRKKVIIIGSGPNRIGQGIEFDYCCVQAAQAVRELGYEAIMINCNPETVSTDHSISDKLYFSPLTPEDVMHVIAREQEVGLLCGVMVQFGGQTSIKLAEYLEQQGIPVLGTSVDSIDLVEDRDRFRHLVHKLAQQPRNTAVTTPEEFRSCAQDIGFPVVVRPSYVIGGQFIEIFHDAEQLEASPLLQEFDRFKPLLVEKFLEYAHELEVDALCDGDDVYIAGIMRHFEVAGIHSGDSSCILPATGISSAIMEQIHLQTQQFARSLQIKGLFNIQFALKEDQLYVLEVNPRASRTVPFVSKAINIDLCKIATQIMLGSKLGEFNLRAASSSEIYAVKRPVFSFDRLPGVNPQLGPEMRATGETMQFARTPEQAIQKGLLPECLKRLDSLKTVVILGKNMSGLWDQLLEALDKRRVPILSQLMRTGEANDSYDGFLTSVFECVRQNQASLVINFDSPVWAIGGLRSLLLQKNVLEIATLSEIEVLVTALSEDPGVLTPVSLQELHKGAQLKQAS
ncbi:MAG: carbamoyl-phosphate synthase large subunit [Pseudomonadota bacterium]